MLLKINGAILDFELWHANESWNSVCIDIMRHGDSSESSYFPPLSIRLNVSKEELKKLISVLSDILSELEEGAKSKDGES